jgi:thiamine biosynthesis lipoprotein
MILKTSYKRAAKLLFLFVSIAFLSACDEPLQDHFKLAGATMGTSYHITVLNKEGVDTPQGDLQQAIDQQLSVINQQMSTYISDSELSKVNDASVNSWITVSDNLFDVLMLSLELGWLSNGALDITVGPLVNEWGFGPGGTDKADSVPDEETLAKLKANIGFQHIEFDISNNSVLKRRPVVLDLSAIAKGFAVDKVSELLLYAGYTDFMVEIGGELRLMGHSPKGSPWKIAIEKPEITSMGQVFEAVSLSNVGMATSGDYRNYFEVDGTRYSHTIDPVTAYPVKHHLASVTVIAESSAYADGLATAINVMGPEKGLQLAQSQGLAIYMIINTDQGFEVRYSDAFKAYINQL